MTDSLVKAAEQSMQEFIAQNQISRNASVDRHIATALAGVPVLYSFVDQLSDDQVGSQLAPAAARLDSTYLKSVASQFDVQPSADALVSLAMKNLEKGREHDLQSLIIETPSIRFLARVVQAIEPPLIAREHIPGSELLGAMEFLYYAAAFSEAT